MNKKYVFGVLVFCLFTTASYAQTTPITGTLYIKIDDAPITTFNNYVNKNFDNCAAIKNHSLYPTQNITFDAYAYSSMVGEKTKITSSAAPITYTSWPIVNYRFSNAPTITVTDMDGKVIRGLTINFQNIYTYQEYYFPFKWSTFWGGCAGAKVYGSRTHSLGSLNFDPRGDSIPRLVFSDGGDVVYLTSFSPCTSSSPTEYSCQFIYTMEDPNQPDSQPKGS